MRSPIAPRTASGFAPVARGLLTASLLAMMLVGCKALEDPGAHTAGFSLIDPTQRLIPFKSQHLNLPLTSFDDHQDVIEGRPESI
jgi:hypothetical protein